MTAPYRVNDLSTRIEQLERQLAEARAARPIRVHNWAGLCGEIVGAVIVLALIGGSVFGGAYALVYNQSADAVGARICWEQHRAKAKSTTVADGLLIADCVGNKSAWVPVRIVMPWNRSER